MISQNSLLSRGNNFAKLRTTGPRLWGSNARTNTAAGDQGNAEGLLSGVFITEKGVLKRNEQGTQKISDISCLRRRWLTP